MKRTPIYFMIISMCLVLLSAQDLLAQQSGDGKWSPARTEYLGRWYSGGYALVVGIDNYQSAWPARRNAAEDAKRISLALEKQGFKVYVLTNTQAAKSEIQRYLNDVIAPKLTESDRFILYFSGHGQTRITPSGPAGYLVPWDGKKSGDESRWQTYISMEQLRDLTVDGFSAKHTLVIADASLSGLLAEDSEKINSTFVRESLDENGKIIFAAGANGDKILDGVFASALFKGISGPADAGGDGFITFSELADYIKNEITSRSRQLPHYGWWSGDGEMVFKPGPLRFAEKGLKSPVDKEVIHRNQDDTLIVSHSYDTQKESEPSSGIIAAITKFGPFTVTECSSMTDKENGLEWLAGPDTDMNYTQAVKWIESRKACGGHWQMPSAAQLRTLYDRAAAGVLPRTLKQSGRCIWALGPENKKIVGCFDLQTGQSQWSAGDISDGCGALAVRESR